MSVTLHTTLGDLKIELFCEEAPVAAENFLALCASNYYDGCIFHRNIKGFIVQTGDPSGTGKGGKSIWGRPFKDEFVPSLKHNKRGIVSMANSGPDTNQSQFFITYQKHSHLNNVYTVFGHVISGFEALDALEKVPVDEAERPITPVRIRSVTIHANPIADSQV
ncbi:Peptidyl-prolyl cis-trans isomerase-like 3 [Balamuthia mandrillaris]